MNKKLLFSSVAAVALCASCSDNLEEMASAPVAQGQERPTVEANIKFSGLSNTRLTLDYKWEDGDVINAMLMDKVDPAATSYYYSNPTAWNALSWTGKYVLVDYINTNYPFAYNSTEDLWHAPTRLVEGNYFFTFNGNAQKGEEPTYDGSRQHVHELTKQVQVGGTQADMQNAYGLNQYYVGYAKIEATKDKGAKVTDLTNVVMVPVLNPIGFQIKNTGVQTYNITKITITGENLASKITIAPEGSGIDADGADIVAKLNARTTNTYPSTDAIVEALDDQNYSEVSMSEPFALASNKNLYIAANVFAKEYAVASGKLKMSIYSKEGLIKDIDLTKINSTELGLDNVITNNKISDLSAVNNIKVTFDDNSMYQPYEFVVKNEDDLVQFIGWNKTRNGVYTATLANPITITKEITDAIKKNKTAATPNNALSILQDGNALTIEAGADLSTFTFDNTGDVIAAGNITLVSNCALSVVKEGVTVTIAEGVTDVYIAQNNGTVDATAVNLTAGTVINTTNGLVKVKDSSLAIKDGNVEVSGVAGENITGSANVKLLSGAEYDASVTSNTATGVLTLTEPNDTYLKGAHSKVVASTTMDKVDKFKALGVTEMEVSDASISIAKDKDYSTLTLKAPKASSISVADNGKVKIEASENVSISVASGANVTVTIASGKTATVTSVKGSLTVNGAGNLVIKKDAGSGTVTKNNTGTKKDWR